MRALVAVMPIAGHVAPMTAVVAELLARGHDVTVYTGSRYHSRFTDLGADVLGWSAPPQVDEEDLAAAGRGFWRIPRLMAKVEQVFVRTGGSEAGPPSRPARPARTWRRRRAGSTSCARGARGCARTTPT